MSILKKSLQTLGSIAALGVVAATPLPALAQSTNPCAPKAGKAMNPCAPKAAKAKAASIAAKAEPAPISLGALQIAVSPWGEVYVDGQSKGIAPPLTKLNLPVGKHKIEIKNGDDNYAVTVEINTEKEVKIAHRF